MENSFWWFVYSLLAALFLTLALDTAILLERTLFLFTGIIMLFAAYDELRRGKEHKW